MIKSKEQIQSIAQAVAQIPGATVEVCGLWVWVDFASKPAAEVRTSLKAAGFRWARKKGRWYFPGKPCGGNRHPATMEHIRMTYGSEYLDETAAA